MWWGPSCFELWMGKAMSCNELQSADQRILQWAFAALEDALSVGASSMAKMYLRGIENICASSTFNEPFGNLELITQAYERLFYIERPEYIQGTNTTTAIVSLSCDEVVSLNNPSCSSR